MTTAQRDRGARGAAAIMGLLFVAPLLAWVYGLGSFSGWFRAVALPALVGLVALGLAAGRTVRLSRMRVILAAGVVGGLVGAVGYDLFRVPFVLGGLRVLAPIDSYGVLLLGADSSSAWTGLAGWAYHFANGAGFGVAYAAFALGRHWRWAVLWAMVLETATIITPFAADYGLRGKWHLIAIAYAAHVFYGYPLGRIVQGAATWDLGRPPVRAWAAVATVTVILLAWHRPWSTNPNDSAGRASSGSPSALVVKGRFAPEWLRVAPGRCATLHNRDAVAYKLPGGRNLAATSTAQLCLPDRRGVHRVKLSERTYSGGFVIVDPALGD